MNPSPIRQEQLNKQQPFHDCKTGKTRKSNDTVTNNVGGSSSSSKRPRQHHHRTTTKLVLSAICTILVFGLVVIVVLERHYPQSGLAQLVRRSPSSKSAFISLQNNSKQQQQQGSTTTQLTKRRRLEDQEEDDNEEDNEEDNQNDGDDQQNNEQDDDEEEDDAAGDDAAGANDGEDDYYEFNDDDAEAQEGADDAEDDAEEYYEETEAPTETPEIIDDDDFYKFDEDPGPPRLLPLSSRDVAAFLFASMGLTLGASGGIGGGGIVVPVYILVAGLTPKMAIPLGAVTVLGGSVASTYINSERRHPLADRPIIDWDLVLVTEPLTLIGTLVGVLLHRVLSEKFLIVLLVLLLSVSAHSTLAKAKRMHDAETGYIRKLKEAVHMSELAHHPMHLPISPPGTRKLRIVPLPTVAKPQQHVGGGGQVYFASASPSVISPPAPAVFGAPYEQYGSKPDDDNISNMACENNFNDNNTIDNDMTFDLDDEDLMKLQKSRSEASTPRQMGVEERQQILILNPDFVTLRSGLVQEEKFTPRSKIIALCLMFSILMFLNIMIGGGAFHSPWGIQCGGVSFWVVHVIMVAFLVASAWAAQTYLVNRHQMKEIVRFDYVHGDIKWDARSSIIYPALFICAGTFAGMFGIGGGMITVPLMLAMGVHPAVVSATSSAMILFTSFASVCSFLVFDLILYDYAIVCLLLGFSASLFGNKVMRQARQAKSANGRNFERNSYIAFCIGGVILISSLLMTGEFIFRSFLFDDADIPEGLCDGYRV